MNEELPVDSTNHVVFAKLDPSQSEGSGEEEVLGYLEVQPSSDDNDTYYLQSQQIELDGEHVILAQGDEGGEIYVVVRADQEDPSQDSTATLLMQGVIEDHPSESNSKTSEMTATSSHLIHNTSEKENVNSPTENGTEASKNVLSSSNEEAISASKKFHISQKGNQKLLQLASIAENQLESGSSGQINRNTDQTITDFPKLKQHLSTKDNSISTNQASTNKNEASKSEKVSGNIFEKLSSGKGWIDHDNSESDHHFDDDFSFYDNKDSQPRTSGQTSRLSAMNLTQQVSDVLKVIDSSLEEAEHLIAHDKSSHQSDKTENDTLSLSSPSPSKLKLVSDIKASKSEVILNKEVSTKVKDSLKEPLKESLKSVLSNEDHPKNFSLEPKPDSCQSINDKSSSESSEMSLVLHDTNNESHLKDHIEVKKDFLKNDEPDKSAIESKRPKRKAAFQGVPKDLIKTKKQKNINDNIKNDPSQKSVESLKPEISFKDPSKREKSPTLETSILPKRPRRTLKNLSHDKKTLLEKKDSIATNSDIPLSLKTNMLIEKSSDMLKEESNSKSEDNHIKIDNRQSFDQTTSDIPDEKNKSLAEPDIKVNTNKNIVKPSKGKLKDINKQGSSPNDVTKSPRKRKPLDKFDLLKRKKPPSFSPKSLLKFIKPLHSLISPIKTKKSLKSKKISPKTTPDKTLLPSRTSFPFQHSLSMLTPRLPAVNNTQQPLKDATRLPGISDTKNNEILLLPYCDIRVRIQSSQLRDQSLVNTYSCSNCQFTTSRLNNIVYHHKFGCTSDNNDFIWDLDQEPQKKEPPEEPSTPPKISLNNKKTLTPEKAKVKNPLEESDSDDDEEEDKDDASSQTKLKVEDVVWVEWRSLHRPAWIQEVLPRGRRVIVNYIDSNAPKIGVKVHVKRISTFDNAERNKKFLSESKATPFGESVVKAVAKAEDFLRKKCLGYDISASQFFSVEGTFGISQDDFNEDASSEVSDLEPETEEEINDPVKKKERKKRINQKLLKIVKGGHVKSHLLGVYSTMIPSERHRKFHSLSSAEKNALKHVSWFGPIDDEDQQEEIYEYCLGLFKSTCKYGKSYDIVAYMFEVWVPEAIVKAISRLKKVSLPEAEDMFVHNIPSTKELGSPTKCPSSDGTSQQTANELLSLEF